MNEPNSTIADILGLCLLAGKKTVKNDSGQFIEKNMVTPGDVSPVALTGVAAVPTVAPASLSVYLFNYAIPAQSCLLINYVSLYTSLADESSPAVNYGLDPNVSVRWIAYNNGLSTPVTPYKNSAAILNAPCIVLFQGGVTASLQIPYPRSGAVTDQSIYLQARANGYLLDQHLYNVFKRYQTFLPNVEVNPS